MSVVLITDGSANNNDGSGGYCAIIRSGSTLVELTGWEENTTSNRMELMAAIEGLRYLSTPCSVSLVTDSNYMLSTMRKKWYERWFEEEASGLKSKPRPNLDLWRQLVGLTHFHDVQFIKIKGHSGDYWNERADKLADLARTEKLDVTHSIEAWTEGQCEQHSQSGRRCNLHDGHLGDHNWTRRTAKVIYDGDSLTRSLGKVST